MPVRGLPQICSNDGLKYRNSPSSDRTQSTSGMRAAISSNRSRDACRSISRRRRSISRLIIRQSTASVSDRFRM